MISARSKIVFCWMRVMDAGAHDHETRRAKHFLNLKIVFGYPAHRVFRFSPTVDKARINWDVWRRRNPIQQLPRPVTGELARTQKKKLLTTERLIVRLDDHRSPCQQRCPSQ